MPSLLHEALLLLFRNRPELAPELLRDALHVEIPPYTEVRIESEDLTEVLSALAHDADPTETAAPVALAALAACPGLEDERALLYSDLLWALLGEATRSALEALMQSQKYEFQSEFARKHTAIGKALGEARGKALAIIAVLDARGIVVSAEQRDRILACTDLAQLDQWVPRSATVAAAEQLFG